MITYFNFFGKAIPAYGCLIVSGIIIANILGFRLAKIRGLDINDLIILEAYGLLGGFAGAKILYLIVSFKDINWSMITDFDYFNQIMLGGFVFFGGLILGFGTVWLAGRLHSIDSSVYIRTFICFVPFIHGFGRIGCFCAGCCYGIPYNGLFAVTFPHDSYAVSDISLFPVQLLEAFLLFIISGLVCWILLCKESKFTVEIYVCLYSVVRFFLEYLRFDDVRGKLGLLTTSQWISVFLFISSASLILTFYKKEKIQYKGGQ